MDLWTAEGHVVGMLDRDQRTVRQCSFDRHVLSVRVDQTVVLTQRNKTISHRSVPGRTSPHSSCKTRKNGHFWKSLHRLKHALIVAAYLGLITFPSIFTAPTSMSSRQQEPKWCDPCGMQQGPNNGFASEEHHVPDDSEAVTSILRQARFAINAEENFADEFAQTAFKFDLTKLMVTFADQEYDWLPSSKISKKYKEDLSDEELKNFELDSTLINTYEYFQTIAVGVEQMVEDETNSKLREKFERVQNHLNSLLCEFYTAIISRHLTIKGNVPRSVMSPEFRNMKNDTLRCTRNWIIYRNYLNLLEYTIQIFAKFNQMLS